MSLDEIVMRLSQWRADTLETIDALSVCRHRVEESAKRLESPQAVFEYIDFFSVFLIEAAGILERAASDLPKGQRTHVDALRQLASNAALEQRRILKFRDKWINRPLPYEDVRPLLNRISGVTRDQLAAYRPLNDAAARLGQIAGLEPTPPGDAGDAGGDRRALDRRALFTKWFGR
jgi:hypothetical protein